MLRKIEDQRVADRLANRQLVAASEEYLQRIDDAAGKDFTAIRKTRILSNCYQQSSV